MNTQYYQPVANNRPIKTPLCIIGAVLLFLGAVFSIFSFAYQFDFGNYYFGGSEDFNEYGSLLLTVNELMEQVMLTAFVILTGVFMLVNVRSKAFKILFAFICGSYVCYYINWGCIYNVLDFIASLESDSGYYGLNFYYVYYALPLAYIMLIAFVALSGKTSKRKYRDILLALFISLISVSFLSNLCYYIDIILLYPISIESVFELGSKLVEIGFVLFALYLHGVNNAESKEENPEINDKEAKRRTPFHFISMPFLILASILSIGGSVYNITRVSADIQGDEIIDSSNGMLIINPVFSPEEILGYIWILLSLVPLVGLITFIIYTAAYRNIKGFRLAYTIGVAIPLIASIFLIGIFWMWRLDYSIWYGYELGLRASVILSSSLIASIVSFWLASRAKKTIVTKILLLSSAFGGLVAFDLSARTLDSHGFGGQADDLIVVLTLIGLALLDLAFIFPYRKYKVKVEAPYQPQFAFTEQNVNNVTVQYQTTSNEQQPVNVVNSPVSPIAPPVANVAVNTAPQYQPIPQYVPAMAQPMPIQQPAPMPYNAQPQMPVYQLPPVAGVSVPVAQQVEDSEYKELTKLKVMLDEGLITEEDYNIKKINKNPERFTVRDFCFSKLLS